MRIMSVAASAAAVLSALLSTACRPSAKPSTGQAGLESTKRYVVTVFRATLRPDALARGYAEVGEAMGERVHAFPGFIDAKGFTANDGEKVEIVIFDTLEHQRAWREDPMHLEAQQRGRDEFYVSYSITVCEAHRHYSFPS